MSLSASWARFRCALLVPIFLLLSSSTGLAQPYDWGEVPDKHLEMTTYPPDSNATAVVLFDYGRTRFLNNGELEFRRHTRIKILSEGGYDEGTVKIPFYSRDGLENVVGVKGQTIVPTDDGSSKRYKLKNGSVYEEDIDGSYERVRFTLPRLTPGAVIEYSYKVKSESFRFLRSWAFQRDEPTLHSEYVTTIPDLLDFEALKQGERSFDVSQTEPSTWWYRGSRVSAKKYRWVMEDVPALRPEPFMTTLVNHRAEITFQLRALLNRNGGVAKRYMGSWPDLADDLLSSNDFGRELDRGGDLARRAKVLAEGLGTKEAQLQSIYDFVRSKMRWTGEQQIWLENNLGKVFRTQKGSSAEINMLLVAMLRHAGFEAHPVLISTRDHGRPTTVYPFLRQFNDVIAAVRHEDDWKLLDATDPLRPMGLLPERALNGQGWLVRRETPTWIPIKPKGAERKVLVTAQLEADGALSGTVTVTDKGYRALEARRTLREHGAEHLVRNDFFDNLDGVSLSDVTASNPETVARPLRTKVTFELPRYVQQSGDFFYLNPMLINRTTENPLRSPKRTFPVDFAHPRQWTYTFSLRLPDGYTVKEHPENTKVSLPDDSGTMTRIMQVRNGRVSMRFTFELDRFRYAVKEYESLRSLYSRLASAHAQQLVLKRKKASPAASGPSSEDPSSSQTSSESTSSGSSSAESSSGGSTPYP
jgi:transglutaminase-like putative cysteine protease